MLFAAKWSEGLILWYSTYVTKVVIVISIDYLLMKKYVKCSRKMTQIPTSY